MVATIACQSVGMLFAAAITLALLRTVNSAQSWRLFLATGGVIALLFFCYVCRNSIVHIG